MRNKRVTFIMGVTTASVISLALAGCGAEEKRTGCEGSAAVSSVGTESSYETNGNNVASSSTSAEEKDRIDTKDDAGTSENAGNGTNSVETQQTDPSTSQDIFIEKVENLSSDFIMGMDASSVLVEENSGVKYYDFNGQECDVFKTLAESGVNCIRLRVWNDPYDKDGNGYGGGNNDVPTAIELGKRATQYGMTTMIDFHYSDFWADPKKQFAPKAWENMNIDEKCKALSEYTIESLNQIIDAGVDVSYVQIGNEINNGMSGETDLSKVTKLLDAGSKAVRSVAKEKDKDIQIIVHYCNIENGGGKVPALVSNLESNGIDYDIVGLSYYPYWHGDLDNMQRVVEKLIDRYGKKVMLVETSYPFTDKDGDGSGNSFDGKSGLIDGYPATVQGQAHMVRDIIDAANRGGAIGICYWEGVWIPAGPNGANNEPIWEKYGSGWASKYAADYDPNDAGKYYGGCSWDNQAMFDFKGNPLPSLNIFKYVYEGHKADLKVEAVPDLELTVKVGDEILLPEKAAVIYNDPSVQDEIEIIWDEKDLAKLDNTKGNTLNVHGTLKNDEQSRVILHLTVKEENFVLNGSFEDNDRSMWKVTSATGSNPTDYQNKKDDAHDGTFALHFWDGRQDMDFTATQVITGLEPGTYCLECYAQGGDTNDSAKMALFCDASIKGGQQKHYEEPFAVTSWAQWKNPVISDIEVDESGEVTIGVHIISNKSSWGTVDEFILKKEH